MRGRIIGLQLDRLADQGQRFVRILRHPGESVGQGAQIEIIGIEAVRPFAPRAFDLGLAERRLDDTGDANRDLVLKLEDVFERTVEAVGPEMRAAERVDQLGCVPGFRPYAPSPLEHSGRRVRGRPA